MTGTSCELRVLVFSLSWLTLVSNHAIQGSNEGGISSVVVDFYDVELQGMVQQLGLSIRSL
jgi:hypothetical protein